MKRTLQKRLGEDYVLLKVEFTNSGAVPFSYSFAFGNEPWVGDFYRGSKGNIGWTDGAPYKYEGYVQPSQHTFAGYWESATTLSARPESTPGMPILSSGSRTRRTTCILRTISASTG